MLRFLFILLLCYQTPLIAEIYRYKDWEGHWYFSDKPIANQKIIRPQTKNKYKNKKVFFGNVSKNRVRIYKYVSADGVVHLTNSPSNQQYRLVYMGNINPDMKQWKQLDKSKLGKSKLGGLKSAKLKSTKSVKTHRSNYDSLIQSASERFNVNADLLHAVIKAESAYRPSVISPKGAVGLMQLMPATAKRYGVTDRYDPADNINGGTRYLRYLLKLFKYNTKLAVAAYNAGENAVIKYGNQIPPYPETQKYVERVMKWYYTP